MDLKNTMVIKRFASGFSLISVAFFITACATSAITSKEYSNSSDTIAEQQISQSNEYEAESVANISTLSEPPLFTYMKPHIDPIMWTNETEDHYLPLMGEAQIVGRLPGQRELPMELFEEAAIPHDFQQNGTIVYFNDETPEDIWERIRHGFRLPHQSHARIDANIRWYSTHQAYLDRVAQRAEKYLFHIVEEAERMDIPLEIALLPIVESAFQPFAYSHGRAAGIWQFIPSTGKLYGLKQNWWYDGRRDVVASTRAALKFLKNMRDSFDGDWLLALAAYNSGWGTVTKAIKYNKRKGKKTDFWSLDLPRETEGYVPKLLAIAEIIGNPEKYDINLMPIENEPYMAQVDTYSQIDLALAAELAEVSLEELYILNPAYNRWATDPNGPHKLMLPIEKVEIFEQNLADLPQDKRLSWVRHRISKGQSLLAIAEKYNTTVNLIKNVNNIRGNMIREGQNLVIPVASRKGKTYSLSAEQRQLALQNTKRSGQEKITYYVNSGDTFWSISRKFNVGYRNLAKWNGMAPRDTLRPGQKLTIWTKDSAIQRASFSPHSSELITQKIDYRVRRGDSLALISRKFNVDINELFKWNRGLKQRKYLQPGERITLYVDVTQQAGST